jgi:tRNA(fMet)-specific endonuclease VapC
VNKTYMLDTCICSFIMREQPEAVLKRLELAVLRGQRIVSRPSLILKCASGQAEASAPRRAGRRVLRPPRCHPALDRAAVDATTEIKVALRMAGTPIGPNDTAIAGHAIAAGAVLVTNNAGI